MSRRRVVVTGLGLVSPVGNAVAEGWANLLAGKTGIGPITRFDATGFACRFAGEVKGFDVEAYISAKEARHMDTFIHFGIAAAAQAVRDAGLPAGDELTAEVAERIGVLIGSGIGGLPRIEETHTELTARGPRRISPFFVPASIINMISGHVSILHGFKGPNLGIVTACTTGLHSIGAAGRLIEYGDADVMVCGGSEATVSPLGVGGFAAARALSVRNDDPATASRPWDKDRDGFVLGEGAGVLVIEEYEHAKRRGARIYAELAGFGMSADAFHMTAPDVDGPARSMRAALRNAGLNGSEVQYLNAHGTSTPLGDLNETQAIKLTFGDHAKKLVVNSTKSMTGHLLGGAGGIESVFTVLAIHHQMSPPTINIFEQDPQCDLDYCANAAREMRIDVAMKNNFGFGGTNGTLVFRRV
jgi:3-oxoacyl-[acyl-carrier-protein] synthase II